MTRSDKCRTFGFKRFHFLPKDKPPRAEHTGECLGELLFKGMVLGIDVEEGDWHGGALLLD